MAELDRLGWAVSKSYEIAGISFGVRTNSEPFADWLDETFSAYRLDEELAPTYSVLIAEETRPGKRFHLIYEGTIVLVRTRALETIARALLSKLQMLLLPERDDAIYAEMSLIASNGSCALAPPILLPLLETFSTRELARAGLALPSSTTVAIDPATGDLIPMPLALDVPENAVRRLSVLDSGDAEPRATVDRRLAVDAVLSFGDTTEAVEVLSKAQALYRVASHTLNLGRIGNEVGLVGLRRTIERAPCFGLGVHEWKTFPQNIAAILRA